MKIYHKIILYLNTLRFLKFSQIFYRVFYKIPIPYKYIISKATTNIRPSFKPFKEFIKNDEAILSNNEFLFLNKLIKGKPVNLWNNKNIPKLWLYNLHYFNDLKLLDISREEILEDLLHNWIKNNPIGYGIGWEPYPTSIRVVNIVKWLSKKNKKNPLIINSLLQQVRYLEKNIEYHIKGNHLFANAKALVFAGYFFEGKEADNWLNKGIKILNYEIDEQILPDGGHFERSIMYHALALEDILDLNNLISSNSSFFKDQTVFIKNCTKKIDAMLNFLHAMTHPDGNISFFNDSAFNISPTIKDLSIYASYLGFHSCFKDEPILFFRDTGYIRVSMEKLVVLIDVAPVGASYIPAHAHADTLSYEFSYKGKRMVVNSGTSEYSNGEVRAYQRSTAAHSTVEIDSRNSSEVWDSFRVGKRACVSNINIQHNHETITISAKHDGYSKFRKKLIHSRTWIINSSYLEIVDNVYGRFSRAVSRHYFNPDIRIASSDKDLIFYHEDEDSQPCMFLTKKSDEISIKSTHWYPEFGISFENKCINIDIDSNDKITSCNLRFNFT